jgi:hypothetical protein
MINGARSPVRSIKLPAHLASRNMTITSGSIAAPAAVGGSLVRFLTEGGYGGIKQHEAEDITIQWLDTLAVR